MSPNAPPPDHQEEESHDGVNIVAVAFVIVLVLGCLWLFRSLQAHREIEDCVASGRHNCIELDPSAVPTPK